MESESLMLVYQSRQLLNEWYAREHHHRRGPRQPDLLARVGEALRRLETPDDLIVALADEVEAIKVAIDESGQTRLTVDLAKKQVTLDGVLYDVPSENALRWLKVLAEHPGDWISGSDLTTYDTMLIGPRTDRFRKYLPLVILDLIESATGKGSRIRL